MSDFYLAGWASKRINERKNERKNEIKTNSSPYVGIKTKLNTDFGKEGGKKIAQILH